jgi:hypothetical protein
MWSSWVKENGTTQVMYIAKLKDGPKRVKKTFSMILERVFEMVWWRGENGITSKRVFEVEVFFSSQNIDFPFYLKRFLELFFSLHQKEFLRLKCFSPLKILTSPFIWRDSWSFFSLVFFMLRLLRTWVFWWYLRRKSLLQKLLLKWLQYTGGGRIFQNGVVHANISRWG